MCRILESFVSKNSAMNQVGLVLVLAIGPISDPCVFVLSADRMQLPLEFDAQQVDATPWYSLGWGGVMFTFLILAHMVDATQLMGLGWGGSGSDS